MAQAALAGQDNPDWPNTCGNGKDITLFNGFRYYGTIDPGDVDFVKIVVPHDANMRAYTESQSSFDPMGELYNASCVKVAEDWDSWTRISPNDFIITYPVFAGETYYLAISAQSGPTAQGNYNFRVYLDAPTVSNYTVTANAGTGGSISPSGAISVTEGSSLSFTITPDACYDILDVAVGMGSIGPVGSFTLVNITSDTTVNASFYSSGDISINASSGEGGSIGPVEGPLTMSCGGSLTYTITPDAGYEILDVVVDGVSRGPITSWDFTNATADHSIHATFNALANHTITTIAGSNGSISPAGPVSATPGSSQTFTITPDAGYEVDDVTVDGVSQGALSSYTFSNIDGDHTIEAQFAFAVITPPAECLEISDTPLETTYQAAPANIMFILDDSGSMDFEVMTPESDTEFDGKRYVFSDTGDNAYSSYYHILGYDRQQWKSQWPGYNKMYYDPHVTYLPWPTMGNADTANPRSHPSYATYTLDLTDTYVEVKDGEEKIVDDGNSGFSTSGAWETLTGESAAYGSDWRKSTIAYEDKKAYFKPYLIPSTYDIYVRWVADSANHSPYVQYQVYGNGSDRDWEEYIDQRYNGGTWTHIGQEYFENDGYVRLRLDNSRADDRSASADAVKFVPAGPAVTISNAHYYTWHDTDFDGELDAGETVYLVNFVDINSDGTPDKRDWYEFNDNGDDVVRYSELSPIAEASVPAIVRPRTIAEDLQNFANWFSYYRKRELTAIGSIATVITQIQGMQVGFYSIHERIIQPLLKVHVEGVDETAALLNVLYTQYNSDGNTPLRNALLNVGKYFHQDDGETGNIGDSPYASAAAGGECQQCFVIMMTDGAYNGSEPWDPAQDHDSDDGEPYADSYSNTLADIAMYYYENDLSNTLGDQVPTNSRDFASHQHMVTYGIGFGLDGTLTQADYDLDDGPYPVWPDPDGSALEKVDDMWHATVNGRGKFLTASNAVELINDFLMILKDIELYSGSASSVAVNGDELYTKISSEVRLFQSKYYNQSWHGDILSFKINQLTGEVIQPAEWSAAKKLDSKSASQRYIVTYDGTSSGQRFEYKKLTDLQRSMLDPAWETDDTLAMDMVAYLRGESDKEQENGGNFRNRAWSIVDPGHPNNGEVITSSKLGDIVHSSPVFKNGVIYSGGNAGMLHAFDAETGEEIFAYVPHLVFENLAELTSPGYTHKYYVDLTPTVRDVDVGGITTLLIGGLGKGGRGYFALDLSDIDPSQGALPVEENGVAEMVLWEYPNLNTPTAEKDDMGFSFSKVEIVQSYDTNHPWIAIFGNGYSSVNGKAVLFVLDPVSGSLIRRIDTGMGSCNGLSTPTPIDVNYDGKVDYVYAGDLNGHMWKFDLTDSDAANWDVAYYEGAVPVPLFKTPDQPITTRPDVMNHCAGDGYMVLFGTGRLLSVDDLTDTSQQAVYGIWDFGDDADNTEYVGALTGGLIANPHLPATVSLLQQSIVWEDSANGNDWRVLSNSVPDWMTTTLEGASCGENAGAADCDPNDTGDNPDPLRNAGWYLNLPGSGERVVSDVMIRDGKLILISYTPEGSVCGIGGSSWVMQMQACSGARLPGLQGQFDVNGDGKIDSSDWVNINTPEAPIWATVSGRNFKGRLQPPAIIILNKDQEMMYMSSSRGEIETMLRQSVRLGIYYWRIYRP
jgi:type IV pilus assembly protein PilY1